jgi:hypothetical protein
MSRHTTHPPTGRSNKTTVMPCAAVTWRQRRLPFEGRPFNITEAFNAMLRETYADALRSSLMHSVLHPSPVFVSDSFAWLCCTPAPCTPAPCTPAPDEPSGNPVRSEYSDQDHEG